MRHAETCATGARAELRGPCDCNASPYPWAIRLVDDSQVEVVTDGPMSLSDATMLSIAIQELTKTAAQKAAARRLRKDPPT